MFTNFTALLNLAFSSTSACILLSSHLHIPADHRYTTENHHSPTLYSYPSRKYLGFPVDKTFKMLHNSSTRAEVSESEVEIDLQTASWRDGVPANLTTAVMLPCKPQWSGWSKTARICNREFRIRGQTYDVNWLPRIQRACGRGTCSTAAQRP